MKNQLMDPDPTFIPQNNNNNNNFSIYLLLVPWCGCLCLSDCSCLVVTVHKIQYAVKILEYRTSPFNLLQGFTTKFIVFKYMHI